MTAMDEARGRARELIDGLDGPALGDAVAYLQRLHGDPDGRGGLLATLGLRTLDKGDGKSVMEVVAGPHLMNPHGVLHGAVLFAAMDTAMGGAVTSLLAEGETCTTVEAKINYLGAVRSGRLTASATVVQKGSRVAVVEARAMGEDGRLVGLMTGTFMILRPAQA